MGKGWYDWLEYEPTFNRMKLYSAFNSLIDKRLLYPCLRNDLYCVEWGVKLYWLTHSPWNSWTILLLS